MSVVIVVVVVDDDDVAKTCSFAATSELMIAAKVGSRWKKMVIEDRYWRRSTRTLGGVPSLSRINSCYACLRKSSK